MAATSVGHCSYGSSACDAPQPRWKPPCAPTAVHSDLEARRSRLNSTPMAVAIATHASLPPRPLSGLSDSTWSTPNDAALIATTGPSRRPDSVVRT